MLQEQIKMNVNFKTLDCDTDILLIEKDTFTVQRFQELMGKKLSKNLQEQTIPDQGSLMFYKLFYDCSIGGLDLKVNKGQWIFPPEGMDCQILKTGSQGWQKGKLRIKASLTFSPYNVQVQITCEFCPDEPAESESLFDDIRQSEEYKKLTNNN